jgi:hypothetical protein
VNADGSVDVSKMPAALEVAGPDGKPVVCANGRKLLVPRELLVAPPSETPAQLRARGATDAREYVWRCGPGAQGHRNPRRVPLGE